MKLFVCTIIATKNEPSVISEWVKIIAAPDRVAVLEDLAYILDAEVLSHGYKSPSLAIYDISEQANSQGWDEG